MKLIVGLGNYGAKYNNTRHNVGFEVLNGYAECKSLVFKKKYNALYSEYNFNNEKVVFIKPLTYMNLSGEAVVKYMKYFNISIDDVLVIHDDMDIKLGNIRLKSGGSSAGHNGIKSIIKETGTSDFKRLRIGISNKNTDVIDYVLGKFNIDEKKIVLNVEELCLIIIDDFLIMDFDKLMNKYNSRESFE
ncbi:MAG: aminoacyl-tRNA hydrolase [Bacilli bacterium]